MAPINVTTSKQQITANVAEDKVTATVSSGFGATGPSGVVNVTAPITNSGTTTSANVGLSVGSGLSVSGGSLVVTPGAYAPLVNNLVPSANLPSYVDDVLEYAGIQNLPAVGETGKIYVTLDNNKTYRWSGSTYIEISSGPSSTDAVQEGVVNLYFTNQRVADALPVATASVLGGVKIGSGISIDGNGVISSSGGYTLPIATAGALGGVRIGSGITIDPATGVISASSGYTLPVATNSVLGGVKIGSGVTITDGVISVSTNYAAASHTHDFTEVTDDNTYVNFSPTGGSLATALSGIDSAIGAKADAADFDQGVKTTDSPRFASVQVTEPVPVGQSPRTWVLEASSGQFRIKQNGETWVKFSEDGVFFPDGSLQSFAFDGDYTSLTSIPSTFAPSAHKSSHAVGGSDALSPSDIGAASQSHAHSATDVTSGTFDIARIPTGTSSTTVCIGNDARLSDARTPTAHNHAASDINSGVLATARLASSGTASASTYLRGDQTWSSLPAGGSTNVWIPASAFIPRTTNGPGVDSRETSTNKQNFDEVLFDAAAIEYADALVILPSNYNNSTVTARFYWTAASGSGDVVFAIAGRAFANDDALDTAYGTAQSVTDTLLAANDMHVSGATSAVTLGGTPAANRPIQFTVYRDATNASDTLAVDARLLGVEIIYTAA